LVRRLDASDAASREEAFKTGMPEAQDHLFTNFRCGRTTLGHKNVASSVFKFDEL
jgi:hypothetical protein